MNGIIMSAKEISTKSVAIVQFGPATSTSGMRAGEYFQVTIDPKMVSPDGGYIRFGLNRGDEIIGWQRINALTVLEILGEWEGEDPPEMTIGRDSVTMLAVE